MKTPATQGHLTITTDSPIHCYAAKKGKKLIWKTKIMAGALTIRNGNGKVLFKVKV